MQDIPTSTTLSEKVKAAMKRDGRKYTWLASRLGITRVVLYDRLKDNTWSVGEIMQLKQLLKIG